MSFLDCPHNGTASSGAPLSVDDDGGVLYSTLGSIGFLLLILVVLHDRHQPYMLPGDRPSLPLPIDLAAPVRLGHRVGSKLGRKLSSVREEDLSSSDGDDDEERAGDAHAGLGAERGDDLRLRQELLTRQRVALVEE